VRGFAIFASLFVFAASAFGQLDPHTLTITATRQINLQPDQVVFALSVSSSAGTNFGQILAALTGQGITSANFTGINNNLAPQLQWTFTLAAPLANLTTTIGTLTKLQQTITQNNSGLALAFSVNGTQVSQQLQQSQTCSTPDLIADATVQAQKLANAAGLAIGPVLSVSSGSAPQFSPAPFFDFVGGVGPSDFLLGPAPLVTCSATVEFQLQP